MKVAIVHEMLIKLGGAEKVLESLMKLFPHADVFTLIYDEKKVGSIFPKKKIHQQVFSLKSQRVYQMFKNQRLCLLSMPISIESLDFSEYDLVIVSSSGFAHGAITKPETQCIVYSHSPVRYMWDWTNEYKKDIGWSSGIKGYVMNSVFLKLRQWDYMASARADMILANSSNTARRIQKYYKKESHVLYPPVETARFSKELTVDTDIYTQYGFESEGYYIIISALVEFKKIEVAIGAFNAMPHKNLLIIGEGSHRKSLEALSQINIQFCGTQYADDLVALVQSSLGLIFPGEEDFGIVPIEVMAAGKPVFALQRGGLCETVIAGVTGDFFTDPKGSDFVEKFQVFDSNNLAKKYSQDACIAQASNFSEEQFHENLLKMGIGNTGLEYPPISTI